MFENENQEIDSNLLCASLEIQSELSKPHRLRIWTIGSKEIDSIRDKDTIQYIIVDQIYTMGQREKGNNLFYSRHLINSEYIAVQLIKRQFGDSIDRLALYDIYYDSTFIYTQSFELRKTLIDLLKKSN